MMEDLNNKMNLLLRKISSIHDQSSIFSDSIFVITNTKLDVIYEYAPNMFSESANLDNLMKEKESAFSLSLTQETLTYRIKEDSKHSSIAIPIIINKKIEGLFGMFIMYNNLLGLVSLIELLSKIISMQFSNSSNKSNVFSQLTENEKTLLNHLYLGKRDDQIASEMIISKATVRSYINKLFDRFNVRNRVELARIFNELKNKGEFE
ncbi:DNA-binding response regulator [Paenibacillus pinisoli]|uniref:DNA-binding response regulator n=1 Tax=Paenibacillus pinisoli TaxID=1276110 RepID=A0A3A6PFH5_9BACL|nr:LuxR C-terminal-related transcriptional regulator [Paenibacillus pinisoli]RJX39747.1 DNA-binding response regulator [Paenibacillus pinisoli]